MSEPFAEEKRLRESLGRFVKTAEANSPPRSDVGIVIVTRGDDPIAITVPLWMLRFLLTCYEVAITQSKWQGAA